ncbi:hypothetical protein DFH06DRAFT_1476633 [Mycena polygramma]|nr:hypothetical protein DFH06DRAFT_1476633 [Mycena polygramma]
MSAKSLRARIAQIAAEIDLQKKLLNQLEHDKSQVQHQLNAVLDPMARLPVELSSEIFLQSLPSLPEPGAPQPLLLLNICHAWTDIALFTPAIWADIHIPSPCTVGFTAVLPIWFRRARTRPLSIFLRLHRAEIDPDVAAIIWGHSQQLKHLEICCCEDEDGEDTNSDDDEIIDFFGGQTPVVCCSDHEILQLLCLAPNLVEFVFETIHVLDGIPLSAEEVVVLPSLRRFMFGSSTQCPVNLDGILKHLSLPALEAMVLPFTSVLSNDFLAFLRCSSPPLQEIILGDPLKFICLPETLRLIPTLARLEMWGTTSRVILELSIVLTNPLLLLPNLHTLVLHLNYSFHLPPIPYSSWAGLLRMLSTRRMSLRTFHVHLSGSPKPPADILEAFTELEANGMQIYIQY